MGMVLLYDGILNYAGSTWTNLFNGEIYPIRIQNYSNYYFQSGNSKRLLYKQTQELQHCLSYQILNQLTNGASPSIICEGDTSN
jgi:hypothetical protein